VHALFGFLKQQIDQIWALCTAPINIPVLSSFYQTTVVPGEQLTMLSLITLAAAIPLTVTYKLVTGQSGSMFTDDDLAAVRNPNWSGYTAITSSIQQTFGSADGAAGRSVAPAAPDARGVRATAADWVWWGLGGYVYAFSSLAWGICCYIEDSTKNVSKAVTWAKIAFQLLADITCCPAIPLRGTPSPRTAVVWLNWWIWGGGIAALLVNTVTAAASQLVNTVTAAASQVKLEAFAKWMADKADPLFTGIYGFLQLIGYIVIAALWSGWWGGMYFAIGLGESLEWVPQLIKLGALVKPESKLVLGLLVARIELIGYGIVFGGYAALTSALIAQVYTSSDGGSQAAFA
jgi:hypothetical protein